METSTLSTVLNQWASVFNGKVINTTVHFNNEKAKGTIQGYKSTEYLEILKFDFDLYSDLIFEASPKTQNKEYIALVLGNPISGKLHPSSENDEAAFEFNALGAFCVNYQSNLEWKVSKGKARKMIIIRIRKDKFEQYINKSEKLTKKYSFHTSFYLQERFTPRMIEIFDRFFSINKTDLFALEMSEVYAKYLISEFFRKINEREEAQQVRETDLNVQPVMKTKEILEKVIDKPVLIDDLTKEVGLSESRLRVLFKEVFGTTIHQYHQDIRLNKSRELLLKSNKTMSMIASDLGYSSSSHFSMVFKKRFNISPKEYKKDPEYILA
ncbi:AraC family transcriptional regulator [Flammeovirga sp. OC4]|uniref:helix-turn-helix domain-containing protein n=1 Tax=Flammeovirga sp. OC4 TaxID=1382345 RepID=UPI0005C4EB3B|nr:AraC family transcriptional regulator [Flammeovirga sp. OC4]